MRLYFLLLPLLVSQLSWAQDEFPKKWMSNWKGELEWYKGAVKKPKKVMMELRIRATDTAGKYSWQIIYGSEQTDNRPYTLLAKDTSQGHWVIDENNGIVLDQFLVANRFCGAFTVGNTTIINNYHLENDQLIVEFYSLSATPISTTGKGTDDSPNVSSNKILSYQKAVLSRQ